jgi:protein tyrosine phosphatase
VEQEFKRRCDQLLGDVVFSRWQPNKSREDILAEFTRLQQWRESVWYLDSNATQRESHPDFKISSEVKSHRLYLHAPLIAFEYNNTDPSYNSSTISLNGLRFLALEAPSKETLKNFHDLIAKHKVTHLVRLTPALEQEVDKCYQYWPDSLSEDIGADFLVVPLQDSADDAAHKLRYIWIDTWIDHASGTAKELLQLILEARKAHNPADSLVAVHCHAGVARTGTFIAGFILLNAIDTQINSGKSIEELDISIEEIVKKLSLQRVYMVGEPEQYVTLHRLVDLYILIDLYAKNMKNKS